MPFNRYIDFSVEKPPSYKQFMLNMEQKMQDREFLGDTELLLRPKTVISIKKVVVSKMETTTPYGNHGTFSAR